MTQREYATYTFPEDNLLYTLVDLYFKEINTYLPLLHKPTFIAQLVARRHLATHRRDDYMYAVREKI